MTNAGPNRGGRPRRATDPVASLSPAAVALLAERGYSECTMADLARELDVSVRTLHRYFPAKADIVWSPIERALADRRAFLEAADPGEHPMDVLRRAICSSLQDMAAETGHLRAAVRLVAATPELAVSERVRLGTQINRDFLAERLPADAWPPLADVLSAAISTTTMAAMSWWAAQPPGTHEPHTVVDEALRKLQKGFIEPAADDRPPAPERVHSPKAG
ncbi:TetR/AcrR family transcriptional regulator [Actinocorallia herbida]|uniref:TetR/AcrR family transcriptional regulator n=1 Tax=Actinocorallia herbida TaxID=58109 RepID=UPI001476B37D|nr:TetR/AcrR family transcriptional regulator [Actinocorallia herbida]